MTFKKIALCVFFLILPSLLVAAVSILPLPNEIREVDSPAFILTDQTVLSFESSCKAEAELIRRYLNTAVGCQLKISPNAEHEGIHIRQNDALKKLGPEGYHLKVSTDVILIEASGPAGVFYGIQTLRQLLPPEIYSHQRLETICWQIPCIEITDAPRFQWRGLHLDTARHFMSVEYIKKQLELMAIHKLNRFHWHLTDDQGWRIEIDGYPRLTEIGAYREKTLISGLETEAQRYDESRYGGYYTKQQIREIVEYARDRFIEVVPEIEMPGHCSSAIAAYPSLSCTGKTISVPGNWGIFNDVYCVGKEEVFKFNQDVLREVFDLFPFEYIHIGGDEVLKDRWKTCSKCQERVRLEGLKDEVDLQGYFVQRIEKFLRSNGKKLIGWDEILDDKLASGVTLMCWRGDQYALQATEEGKNVILTPRDYCYFDYYQAVPAREPLAASAKHFLPVEQVYCYEPLASSHVLGVQANVWTEWMRSEAQAEYMTWPRACALAEVAWTQPENKKLDNFMGRLETHTQRLDRLEVAYRKARDIAKSKKTIRLMTYNLLYGGEAGRGYDWYFRKKPMKLHTDNTDRVDKIIGIIKKVEPDVLFLQECTDWEWANEETLRDFAQRLNMQGVLSQGGNKFKTAILSKFPISNVRGLNGKDSFAHHMLCADLALPTGKSWTVASLHFGWWGDKNWKHYDAAGKAQSYAVQYRRLLDELAEHAGKDFIAAGDFNHTYHESYFGQECLHEAITALGYVDSCLSIYGDYSRVTSGTFKNDIRVGPIDYIFTSSSLSDDIRDADIVYSVETFEASDHLPVWVDINIQDK